MYKAYIYADPVEDPLVIEDLCSRLRKQGITPYLTERSWKNIFSKEPFLYFRNPYIRFDSEPDILAFHFKNPEIPRLTAKNGEVISYNPTGSGSCNFRLNVGIYYHEPPHDPLPILVGIHSRPLYTQLTLNSLLHSLRHPKQQVYIVASQPDPECKQIIQNTLDTADVYVRAVISDNNLRYSFANFGSKFFNLPKFIHWEEDGILPENIEHYYPFWTCQFNYRSKTTDLLSLKVSNINYASEFYRSELYNNKKELQIPKDEKWFYTKADNSKLIPIGGLGIVIDSDKMYKKFTAPDYCTHDHNIFHNSNNICIANVPVYHLGANQELDYRSYMDKKRSRQTSLVRHQIGTDMHTGETKQIDLGIDWADYNESIS